MQTSDFQDRFTEYQAVLKKTDWYYQYAEGDAYYRGLETYRIAVHEKTKMIRDFPEHAAQIITEWNRHAL